MKDDAIQTAYVRCDKSEHIYQVKASTYIDCTVMLAWA